jgi:hypothetical protein
MTAKLFLNMPDRTVCLHKNETKLNAELDRVGGMAKQAFQPVTACASNGLLYWDFSER